MLHNCPSYKEWSIPPPSSKRPFSVPPKLSSPFSSCLVTFPIELECLSLNSNNLCHSTYLGPIQITWNRQKGIHLNTNQSFKKKKPLKPQQLANPTWFQEGWEGGKALYKAKARKGLKFHLCIITTAAATLSLIGSKPPSCAPIWR